MDERTYKIIKSKIKASIMLNNGYQYDDLCHDAIEKLLRMKKSNSECIKMCVITALNLIRDHHRKCSKINTVKLFDTESEPIQEDEILISEPVENKEIFILRYKLGMKYKEISNHLEIPMGTVKVRIHRMHKELRRINR